VLKNLGDEKTKVGISLNLHPVYPVSQKEQDKNAAEICDGHINRWFLDPLFKGTYPFDMLEYYQERIPQIIPGDMSIISRKIDFLGVNYYTRWVVRNNPKERILRFSFSKPEKAEYTEMGWEIYPQGIYDILKRVQDDYSPHAIYITENGAAFPDRLDKEGKIKDDKRIKYLKEHLSFAHKAIERGVKLKGYFVWSLIDNFEWTYGYSKRFGIIYIDYSTQKRIFKESAYWYQKVIKNNSIV